MATVYRYSPSTNSYTTLPSFSVATWAQTAVYMNGKIYKIAGCGFNCVSATNAVEVYTIATNTWASAASYPISVGWLMATSLNGYTYTAGGTIPSDVVKTYPRPSVNQHLGRRIYHRPSRHPVGGGIGNQ